jgi:hypothetical protein
MSDKRYNISREAFPVVQMTLRGMGEVVQHAVALHAEDIAKVAQDAVKSAIAEFDWKSRISHEVEEAITRQIKFNINQFLWHGEGDQLVKEAVARAIAAAFGGKDHDDR